MLKKIVAVPTIPHLLATVSTKVVQATEPALQHQMGWWLNKLVPELEKSLEINPEIQKILQDPSSHYANILALKKQILSAFKDRKQVVLLSDVVAKVECDIEKRGASSLKAKEDIIRLKTTLKNDYISPKDVPDIEAYMLDNVSTNSENTRTQFQNTILGQLSRRKKPDTVIQDEKRPLGSSELETIKKLSFEDRVLTQFISRATQKKQATAEVATKKPCIEPSKVALFEKGALTQLIHRLKDKTEDLKNKEKQSLETKKRNNDQNRRFVQAITEKMTQHHKETQEKIEKIAIQKQEKLNKELQATQAKLAKDLQSLYSKMQITSKRIDSANKDIATLQSRIQTLEHDLANTHYKLFTNEQILAKTYDTFFQKKEALKNTVRDTQMKIETATTRKKKQLEHKISEAKTESTKRREAYKQAVEPRIDKAKSDNDKLNKKWEPIVKEINQFNEQKDKDFETKKVSCTTIFACQLNAISNKRYTKKSEAINAFNEKCHTPLAQNRSARWNQIKDLSTTYDASINKINRELTQFDTYLKNSTSKFDERKGAAKKAVSGIESSVNQLD